MPKRPPELDTPELAAAVATLLNAIQKKSGKSTSKICEILLASWGSGGKGDNPTALARSWRRWLTLVKGVQVLPTMHRLSQIVQVARHHGWVPDEMELSNDENDLLKVIDARQNQFLQDVRRSEVKKLEQDVAHVLHAFRNVVVNTEDGVVATIDLIAESLANALEALWWDEHHPRLVEGLEAGCRRGVEKMQTLLLARTAEWKELEDLPPIERPLVEDEPERPDSGRPFARMLRRN